LADITSLVNATSGRSSCERPTRLVVWAPWRCTATQCYLALLARFLGWQSAPPFRRIGLCLRGRPFQEANVFGETSRLRVRTFHGFSHSRVTGDLGHIFTPDFSGLILSITRPRMGIRVRKGTQCNVGADATFRRVHLFSTRSLPNSRPVVHSSRFSGARSRLTDSSPRPTLMNARWPGLYGIGVAYSTRNAVPPI
jgi:hypothetical protein